MSPKVALLIARGALASLPAEERGLIEETVAKIRAIMKEQPEGIGQMAVALISTEVAVEDGD